MVEFIGQSIGSAALVIAIVYLARNLIEARLTRSVQHEFDQKLASFRAALEAESNRQEAVRSTAFAALLAQRSAVATKRIDATQGLWDGVMEAKKGLSVALTVEILNIDALAKRLSDPKIQQYLATIGTGEVMERDFSARLNRVAAYRPFVSPMAWALYSVYSTVIVFSVSQLRMLQLGENPKSLMSKSSWVEFVGDALPKEEVMLIGSDSNHGLQWAMNLLEQRILDELRESVAEESAGLDSVANARRILEAADISEPTAAVDRARASRAGVARE